MSQPTPHTQSTTRGRTIAINLQGCCGTPSSPPVKKLTVNETGGMCYNLTRWFSAMTKGIRVAKKNYIHTRCVDGAAKKTQSSHLHCQKNKMVVFWGFVHWQHNRFVGRNSPIG